MRCWPVRAKRSTMVAAEGFDELGRAFDRLRVVEPRARLCRMADVYAEYARLNPRLYRIMFGLERGVLGKYEPLRVAAGGCFTRLKLATAAARGADGASTDNALLRDVHAIWSIVHGCARLDIDDVVGFLPPAARTPASRAVEMYLQGLEYGGR
jgi:hypothetical protein